jgi:DNA-binding LacI/PurR family transcriptional regulator
MVDDPGVPVYLRISREIERLVDQGLLKTDDKLPSTLELAKRFNTTPKTIQKGMSFLVRKGLLARRPGFGTVVTSKRCSLSIGFVSSLSPRADENGGFVDAVMKSLMHSCAADNALMSIYTGLDDESFDARIVDLENALTEGRINVIVTMHRSERLATWLRDTCRIAWVLIPSIDMYQLTYGGTRYLLSQGYRKIWLMTRFGHVVNADYQDEADDELRGFHQAYKEAGLEPDPQAIQRCGDNQAQVYQSAMNLLKDPQTRPEAIFSNTDSRTPGLILALAHLGIRIPEDVAVLTHKNKGIDILSSVPLTAMVVDPDEVADCVYDNICSMDDHGIRSLQDALPQKRGASASEQMTNHRHKISRIILPKLEVGLSCGESQKAS